MSRTCFRFSLSTPISQRLIVGLPRIARSVGINAQIPSLPQSLISQKRYNASNSSTSSSPLSKIVPKFKITFTCKACDHRSSHEMTKQAYTKGTILIQCPSCKNRHLIADNLKIFSDKNINIEDILREQGQTIQKAQLKNGDVEFLPPDILEEEVKQIS